MPSSSRPTHNLRELHTLLELTKTMMDDVVTVADSAYRNREVRVFASEGVESDQAPWPELSDAYQKMKARKRPGRKILVWDGTMRESFSTKNPAHVAYAYNIGRGWVAVFGATGPSWWEDHQKGFAPMPKRDPQQSGPQLQVDMKTAIKEALLPHVQRAGRAFVQAMRVRNG